MKPIAVLCPGPSLPKHWEQCDPADYSEIVAVNTAGHVYVCDWLAFADWHIIRPIEAKQIPPPCIGCLCKPGMAVVRGLRYEDLSQSFPKLGIIPTIPQDPDPKCGYTFANTLAWLQHRTNRSPLHVFGFDCSPQLKDFTGQLGDHSNNRWLKELLWIKAAWGPNITVRSDLSQTLLEWLYSPSVSHMDLMKRLDFVGL